MRVLIPALVLIALLVLFGGWICYRIAFFSPRKGQNDDLRLPAGPGYDQHHARMRALIARLAAEPCERVAITSRDGLRLAGRYYHRADGAPLTICMHGYRGTALRDFCGGASLSLASGHNVLLIDERAHGASAGHAITMGARERYDCLDWIAWANARLGRQTPVWLSGISMGAATVVMAAGLPLPENVRGVLADCPYAEPRAILRKVMRDMGLPGLLYPLLALGARLFAGFSPAEASAPEAARRTRVPILIIHGEGDRFVPAEMSAEIAAVNPEKVERHTFPGAAHGMSYMEDEERYCRIVREFWQKHGAA